MARIHSRHRHDGCSCSGLRNGPQRCRLKGPTAHWLAFAGTVFFFPCYVAAIWWCGAVGSSRDAAGNSYVWTVVTLGRIVGVLLFTAVALLAIWGHRLDA